MEDFGKMVEGYKWRGSASKQKLEDMFARLDATPAAITHSTNEQGSAKFECTESPPKRHKTDSSASSSFLQSMIYDVNTHVVHTEMGSLALRNRPNCSLPGHRDRSRKKPNSQSNPSRKLVFSEGISHAKGQLERKTKSKKVIKKGPNKKKEIQMKQDGVKSTLHAKLSSSLDFYSDGECENGTRQLHSPEVSDSSGDHLSSEFRAQKWKSGRARTSKPSSPHSLTFVTSHYFTHAKQQLKTNSTDKDDDNHVSKSRVMNANVKPPMRKCKKKVSSSQCNAKIIEVLCLAANHSEVSEQEDPSKKNFHLSEQLLTSSDSTISKATSNKKESIYFTTTRALGQRDITNKTWVPPISVHGLIQEELYQDPWKVLVACMLLNRTSGKQMREIIWDLFALCPNPEAAVAVETSKIEEVIRGLGLQKKRARMIQKFSKDYLGKEWSNVGELHGIGKYATDAYAIFCEGRWREVEPQDHKLVEYWQYLCATEGIGYAYKDDRKKSDDIQ